MHAKFLPATINRFKEQNQFYLPPCFDLVGVAETTPTYYGHHHKCIDDRGGPKVQTVFLD